MTKAFEFKWKRLGTSGSSEHSPRIFGHASTLVGHEIFVFGGIQEASNEATRDMHVFDIRKRSWKTLPPSPGPSARDFHRMMLVDEDLYIYGGRRLTDMHRFNVIDKEYCEVLQNIHTVSDQRLQYIRQELLGESVEFCEKLEAFILFGSSSDFRKTTLQKFSLTSKRWSSLEVKGTMPQPRKHHSSCMLGNRLYIAGGVTAGTRCLNDVHVFTFLSNRRDRVSCATLSRNDNSRGFAYAPMVYFDGSLFIYGGLCNDNEVIVGVRTFRLDDKSMVPPEENRVSRHFEGKALHSVTLVRSTVDSIKFRLIILGGLVANRVTPNAEVLLHLR